MIKAIMMPLLIFLFYGNVFATDIASSYLKGEYELALIYGPKDEIVMPLKILKNKTMTPTLEGGFVYTDGIYCSTNGNYLEGLCRFKDRNGGMWEMRFSAEPSAKKGCSIFTVDFYKDEKGFQQIDFVFKGKPGDIMNMGITPFCIQGMPGRNNCRFAICLNAK